MSSRIPLSIVDFSAFFDGERPADAFRRSVAMAQKAEQLGFSRVWYSEHHNSTSIASAVPALVIAHVAAQTSKIRLGAGGVMLPNHSPYIVAEQFGTLEEMYPGRIDLGLGRAPGTDRTTLARALRRPMNAAENFPSDIIELMHYLKGESLVPDVQAIPGRGTQVPLYVLGSSLYGAQLSAKLGLPYSFASHLFPPMLEQAVKVYRDNFEPSEVMSEPYVIAALNVTAADTEEEAHRIHEQMVRQHVTAMHFNGRVTSDGEVEQLLSSAAGAQYASMLDYYGVGTGEQVADYLQSFAEKAHADELMLLVKGPTTQSSNHSMELIAQAWGLDPEHTAGDPTTWRR
ncbi:LLM class flavin-dependent oxidoreductase [Corynebacterium crudilactis]|uniref:Alkane 1-monooxygenase n=1 Tax=Corynebacterium crudilactis TaxID=1652495 RepID=A0A172QQC5_9CORY|nr:LLM class flavin-dependent oxidoreductase [Corynebacterium crudilactis]ANE02870.1 alkane 1-monooxygenase [Corynebacterium crudilactis]